MDVFAGRWVVRFLQAFEAVELAAWTAHDGELHHGRLGAEVGALVLWTVAEVLAAKRVVHQHFTTVEHLELGSYGDGKFFEDWRLGA